MQKGLWPNPAWKMLHASKGKTNNATDQAYTGDRRDEVKKDLLTALADGAETSSLR